MRFFALPDSNTSQRVTISVLGHVVVSQMDIVQVPYATVTGKYVRALSYGILVMAYLLWHINVQLCQSCRWMVELWHISYGILLMAH